MGREGSALDVTVSNQYLKVLVVGGPGTGKSQFAATFPTPGYVFDCDGGIVSYKKKDFTYSQFDLSNAGYVDFTRELKATVAEAKEGKYQTIVLDSTSSLTDMAMERALTMDPKRSPTGGPVWNIHYSMVKHLVESTIKALVSLPCNLVVIAHKEIVKNEDDGSVVAVEPLLTGNLSRRIPGLFDEVYYATTKNEGGKPHWYLQTVPRGLIEARSRISGRERILPDLLDNDYASIMAHIHANKSHA